MKYKTLLILGTIAVIALAYRIAFFVKSGWWLDFGDLGHHYYYLAQHIRPPTYLGDWIMYGLGYLFRPDVAVNIGVALFQVLPVIPLYLYLRDYNGWAKKTHRYIAYGAVILYLIHPFNFYIASAPAFKLFVGITIFGWIVYRMDMYRYSHKHDVLFVIEFAVYPFLALFTNIYIFVILGVWAVMRFVRAKVSDDWMKAKQLKYFAFWYIISTSALGLMLTLRYSEIETIIQVWYLVLRWDSVLPRLSNPLILAMVVVVILYGITTYFERFEWLPVFGILLLPWYEIDKTYLYWNRYLTLTLYVSTILGALLAERIRCVVWSRLYNA